MYYFQLMVKKGQKGLWAPGHSLSSLVLFEKSLDTAALNGRLNTSFIDHHRSFIAISMWLATISSLFVALLVLHEASLDCSTAVMCFICRLLHLPSHQCSCSDYSMDRFYFCHKCVSFFFSGGALLCLLVFPVGCTFNDSVGPVSIFRSHAGGEESKMVPAGWILLLEVDKSSHLQHFSLLNFYTC